MLLAPQKFSVLTFHQAVAELKVEASPESDTETQDRMSRSSYSNYNLLDIHFSTSYLSFYVNDGK